MNRKFLLIRPKKGGFLDRFFKSWMKKEGRGRKSSQKEEEKKDMMKNIGPKLGSLSEAVKEDKSKENIVEKNTYVSDEEIIHQLKIPGFSAEDIDVRVKEDHRGSLVEVYLDRTVENEFQEENFIDSIVDFNIRPARSEERLDLHTKNTELKGKDSVQATLENGILTIRAEQGPKARKEEDTGEEIEIE